MEDNEKAITLLKTSDQSYEDLEWLSIFLLCLEDYRNYAKNLSQVLLIQLVRNLSITTLSKRQHLFKKGDHATTWYVVFEGELELYHTVGSENKIVNHIPKGKQVGEREILRHKAYNLSCIPNKTTWLLSLPQKEFISLLGDQLNNRLLIIRNFVHSYLPNLESYSWNYKEKIGYLFSLSEYKRGETVINKDFQDDKLYFVYEGEAAICVDFENRMKNVVKLGKGMCFAEECALMGKPCMFNIRISSERAVIASIRRMDLMMLPDETIATLKKNLQDKIKSRRTLLDGGNLPRGVYSTDGSPMFKSANRQAREKLMKYILRNKPCTPKRILNISRVRNKQYKEFLEVLRDCSPRRMKVSSDMSNYHDAKHKRHSSLPFP
jgi:CRP-like cAMP-binding protein